MSAKNKKSSAAGGFSAIGATLSHLRRETGLVRGTRLLLRVNQENGFDCPGCAWPEPSHRSRFEFCENGAKAVAEEATKRRVDAEVVAKLSLQELDSMSEFELGRLGRVVQPLVARPGDTHFSPIDWDTLFKETGKALAQPTVPGRLVFYASGRTSNEAAFLYQLMARALGTNNLPDCSNMCHESSGYGLKESVGVGKGTVSLEDFEQADLILVVGQNPGTNHPRMLSTLREAAKRGCRIVSINPLREVGLVRFSHPQKPTDLIRGGVSIESLHVPLRIGSDVALFQGVAKLVVEGQTTKGAAVDSDFIVEHTSGYDEYVTHLRDVDLSDVIVETGVTMDTISELANLYASSDRVITCWAMGLTQHENAVANIQEIANLMLLRGNLGKPGAGLCPVRGHSNVQGDRTVGITTKPAGTFLDALEREFSIRAPRDEGLDTLASIEAMSKGHVDVLMTMGGNLHSATPDTHAVAAALKNVAVGVHVTTKLNKTHLVAGQTRYILPCLGRTERDVQGGVAQCVTVEDSMSMVHASRGTLEPAGPELRSEPAIVAGLAKSAVKETGVPWEQFAASYDSLREAMGRVLPAFAPVNQAIAEGKSVRLPNGARERQFATASGKATFTCHPLPRLSLQKGEFRMMTIRSHDQYNTTIYGLDDRYRGVYGKRYVAFMNPLDVEDLELSAGDRVHLVSEYDGQRRRVDDFAVVPYEIPRGSIATYFPEANPLVPLNRFAKHSRTPISKSIVVRVLRSTQS